jgi:hypothetical protein
MAAKTSSVIAVQWVEWVTGERICPDDVTPRAVGMSGRGRHPHMRAARTWFEQSHAVGSIAQATNHPADAGGGL